MHDSVALRGMLMRMILHVVHTSGVPVEVQLDHEEVDQLDAYIARLLQTGYRPPAQPWPTSPEGLPICPRHQAVMAAREKQGDIWHSHRVVTARGEELYCRGFAYGPAEKDGFHHAGAAPSSPSR